MTYPIPVHLRRIVFVAAFLLTIVVAWLMAASLTTDHAAFGIVSLELARSPEVAGLVIGSWSPEQQAQAASGVRWDFLWLIAYSTTISLACVWAAGVLGRSEFLAKIGLFLAWLIWLAALLDAAENVALLQMLGGSSAAFWPALSYWCAMIKFDIVILALLYVVIGGLAFLWQKMRPTAGRAA